MLKIMPKRLFSTFLCLSLIVPYALGATDHDNKVCFDNVDRISINPGLNPYYSITTSQPWYGFSSDSNSPNCFTVKAGRKGSKDVADWLKSNTKNTNGTEWVKSNSINTVSLYGMPEVFNFGFLLKDIVFWSHGTPLICYNIYMGQSASSNGWWLFSNNNNQQQNMLCYAQLNEDGSETILQKFSRYGSIGFFGDNKFLIGGSNISASDNQVSFLGMSVQKITLKKSFIDPNNAYFGAYFDFQKNPESAVVHIISARGNNTVVTNALQAEITSTESTTWDEKNMVGALMDGRGTPKELSFAVNLDLTLTSHGATLHCRNIYLGQGEKSSSYNWWIISNNNKKNQTITCIVNNIESNVQDLYVTNDNKSTDQFKISEFK